MTYYNQDGLKCLQQKIINNCFSKHTNQFQYSRWAYCGVHYIDSAVMADPSQPVPTGWETDAVNPSSTSCPAKLCHHLPKGHLGPPWGWSWFLIHLLDVCREYPKKLTQIWFRQLIKDLFLCWETFTMLTSFNIYKVAPAFEVTWPSCQKHIIWMPV